MLLAMVVLIVTGLLTTIGMRLLQLRVQRLHDSEMTCAAATVGYVD